MKQYTTHCAHCGNPYAQPLAHKAPEKPLKDVSESESEPDKQASPGKHRNSFMRPHLLFVVGAIPIVASILYARDTSVLVKKGTYLPLLYNLALSIIGYFITLKLIPEMMPLAIKANLAGIDLNKKNRVRIPEALGVVPATVFLCVVVLFQLQFMPAEMNAALTSICMMVLLGFADDVLELRWRFKMLFPAIATLPLLVAYEGATTVAVPHVWPLISILGTHVNLGFFYLVYMLGLAIFSTNAINIYAGLNGLETSQSIVVSVAVLIHNVIELSDVSNSDDVIHAHLFSLFIIIPFIATTLALLKFNWFPASVFVGDTFTYFAGMTLSVVGILGHFSKTLLILLGPQILNFAVSLPQLIGIIPCPKHRIPKLNKETGRLEFTGQFTLIQGVLWVAGPLTEERLVSLLIIIQIVWSALCFWVRYTLASYVFPQ